MSDRLTNLDFLRGFFVLLALDQHFSYYLNVWYVDYFRDAMALKSTYANHLPLIGKQLAVGPIEYWLALIFTPWVSQIYLTMSAFNLSKRSPADFKEGLSQKLKIFGLIFIFFIMENFIVAPNTGEAISFYPIMLWMLVLSFLSILYSFLGIRGVVALAFLSILRFIVPIHFLSDFWEETIRNVIHPGYEYDARLEYFFMSGCLGFIMGYIHYHKKNFKNKKDFYFIALGLILVLCYYLWGDRFTIDPSNVFLTEHELASTFFGTLYIIGVQSIVISIFLWLESRDIKFNLPVINWIGFYSLLVFSMHRIVFVKLIAPLSTMFGSLIGYTLAPTSIQLYVYIIITLLICYFIKITSISGIVFQKKD